MAFNVEGASPPVFEQIFRNARFAQGGNALFEGKVAGSPRPQVVWTRQGLQMQGSDKHQMMYDEASGKVSLLIKAIGPGDEGEYTCTALNPYGEAICTVYISPEATSKAVKKSKSGHKLHKSKSGHDQQMLMQQQQQQQMQVAEQQQLQPVSQQQQSMQKSFQQQSFQQSFQQSSSSMSSSQQSVQQQSAASFQQASSLQQASSFQQSSNSSMQQASSFQQSSSSSMQQASSFQQSSSLQQKSSFQQVSSSQQSNQMSITKEQEPETIYLKHVERQSAQQKQEELTQKYAPPQFMTPLNNVTVNEGERSHFEAKVGPAGDPSMTVEWFHNGQLLPASSRINSGCQFGFVTLDMLNTETSDAGEYTCIVKSEAGMDKSFCCLYVNSRKEIESEMHSQSLKMVQESHQAQQVVIQEEVIPAPKFTRPLQNMGERMEGSSVKLEAQITPSSDASMKIEWYKDGQPITASSRIGTIFSFGYVSLNISGLRSEDSGNYICRAVNRSGEDRSEASFVVKGSNSLTASTGLEEQRAYIQKTEQLEQYQASKMMKSEMTSEATNQAPEFKTCIKDQCEVKEGGFAHFEARLEPMGDHTMKVEWLKDGRPVEASSRITSFFNFGYVALTIKQVANHDQGTYACVASNACGRVETKAQLRMGLKTESEFQAKNWESIQKLESQKTETRTEIVQEVTSSPKFVSPLKGTNVVLEGQRAHFECRVEPQNDPKMSIQWYFNGQVLQASSRIQTFHDFGYVAIDIADARKEDSGTYTLVATNILGTQKAEVQLNVDSHAQVDYSSMHSKTVQETARFETKQEIKQEFEEIVSHGPPVFKTTLQNPQPVSEGQNIHLEARLEPIGDPSMRVEWFFNGRPLTIGTRFKTYNDFGFIALDIMSVTPQDQGQYTCRAKNKMGETSTQATVQVIARSNVITETEHETAMQQINYLETEKVKLAQEEEVVKVAPTFTKSLKNIEAGEGQNIHLEARLAPTGDSTMRVEWTVNGKPLKTGHRFRPAYDFDYVALDVLTVYPEDSGVYTCHARNAYGEAVSSATIKVIGQSQIVSESKTEMSQFQSFEQKSMSTRMEFQEETTSQAPVFTSSPKSIDVAEGQKAHFEARIIPVSDPTLNIDWFFNGQPIKLGSRFREGHDFGFVSLDISHVLPEDAGQYSCRATNSLGQAVCSANMNVRANQKIVKETIHESALQQINYLESQRGAATEEEGSASQAPQFTANMRDQQVVEGAPAHFEAKLVPIGDAKLRVEWLKDGRPIDASNRMTFLHDFGFVALDLKYTRPGDSGRYTIRAVNGLGQAEISANLKVLSGKGGAEMESMHEEALNKIAYLERNKAKMDMNEDDAAQTAPKFVAQLQGKNQLLEGQNAHLECRIDPYPDATLKVEWFHNGKPLPFGNRWRTTYDFGFAALDILGCYASDSGTYTIKATNILGSAESSANIKIATGKGLLLETDHEQALNKIKYLESKHQKTAEEELAAPEAPQFGRQLKNLTVEEGAPAHFESTLTPVNDATMKVEWLFNGKEIKYGSRFRTTYDFGFVALDILYAYPEDSGTYTCVAKNVLGETKTQCTLQVSGKAGLMLDTMDRDRLHQLRNLENRERVRQDEVEQAITKPVFTTPLNNVDGAPEGGHVHLECRLDPVNDPNLKVEWFINGKEIKYGSRFRTTHDFGYVALDITPAYAEDSGTYMCKATNKLGEAVNTGNVNVSSRKGLLLDSHHPEGWEKMREMESRRTVTKLQVEEHQTCTPRFLKQFQGVTMLAEGQHAHFEGQIEPINDANLRVEFLHNGKQLQQASRIHTVCDFGYVALDIGSLVSSDAGEYVCIIKNALGESRASVNLNVAAKGTLDISSQRPEGLEKIKELESRGQRSRADEVQTFQKPVFTTALQNVAKGENQAAHLAARLIPVGDPSLQVEWMKDGKILETGSRIKTSVDFGLVSLDITSLRSSDAGIYTCKAVNMNGEATSTTSIKVQDDQSAVQDDAKVSGPPKFVTQVASKIEIAEGQSAHFEARLTPTEDPNMKVEWFKNGEPLATGHRYRTFNDFGIVILDILYCYAEDSGTYECRASNKLGKDSTKGTVSCSEKSGLILTPQVPGEMREQTLQQIQHLESHKMTTSVDGSVASTSAPRFTSPIANTVLKEGENAHFEGRLTPTDDANLSVEWFWNGKALKAGSRIRTFCDFGFVILEISPVYPEDAGEYTCRAKNALGEAVTTATLSCSGRRNIIMDSQLPSGMEGAMDRIAALEGLGRTKNEMPSEEDLNQPPDFLSPLSDQMLAENSLAHFETRLTPINDPSMKVEWFHNGKALSAGSRIKTINDFGFVILEVANVMTRDSGSYTCKAVNRHGESSVSCNIQVKTKQNIVTDPQLPKSFQTGTDSINNLEERMWKREDISYEEMENRPPIFVTKPHDVNCYEGQPAHFDCRIEPIGDGSMRVDWYHDGKPIQIGSRIHTINDFGFIVLDIDWTFKRDTGVYKCIATNRCGSAEISVNLNCKSKKDIIMDSQLPQGMSMDRLKEIEARKAEIAADEESEITAPKFITQIKSRAVGEGEPAHFECRVEPKNDSKLQVKWYHNNKEVDFGHRFRLTFEFGYVALDILYTYPEDEGEYVCKAFNELGEDITKAELKCKEMPAIQLENQVPRGMKRSETLVQMEAAMKKYTTEMYLTEDDVYDSEKRQPPRFVTQIQSITSLEEMQAAKFECQLAPVGDPNMKVEWFWNGKPLSFKTRFTPIYDFGYVAMNFGWVYPEDSGEYICRATNAYGSDETRAIIKCSGKTGIVYESQLPKGMMSIEKIREMESGWQRAPELLETEQEKFKPCFVTKPEAVATTEGGSARFCCRVTGYPKPRVMWLINGHTVINGSRHKLIYDGMWHLDIPKCQDRDGGKIEVIARNQCGEAYASTTLKVSRRKDDYRNVLKHNVKRDFLNSDEYREPDWLVKMKELKKKLAETEQAPKFIREIKEVRLKEGQRARFEAGYAGYPKPEVTWYFKGEILKNSSKVQIKVREDSSTLTIIDCSFDDSGMYECRAANNLGTDKTKGSLTVNKMTEQEKEEYEKLKASGLQDVVDDEEKKVVKKEQEKKAKDEKKKVVKKEKVEEKKTYDWKKGVKKGEKKEPEQPKAAEKVVLKKPKMVEKPKEEEKEGIKLKPVPPKEKEEPEKKEGVKLKPIPQKEKEEIKKPAPKGMAPQKVKAAKEEISEVPKKVSVIDSEGPMKAIADIRMRIEHGASSTEVISAYEAHEFPELEKVESQMAMIKAVERVGQSSTVQEVLEQECLGKKEIDLQNVGFKALISTIEKESFKVDEVITQFQEDDFEENVVQERLGQLVTQAQQLDTAQVRKQSAQIDLACAEQEVVNQETETVQETRKVSFKQEEIHVSSASSEMTSATKTIQETQVQEQVEQQGLDQAQEISEGDAFYALATFVSETGEAMNLVEGERVYVLEWNNADWWYVRKHLTEETGWVPAQYLKDEETYTMYVQRKLVEKIEKLPVFEKPKDNENACAPKITEKVKSQKAPDGAQVEFVCKVEGYPRPQITWFRQTAIIKPSPDFQIYYDDNNMATLVIKEVFPEDAGTFTCVAKNCVGFASSSAELVVEYPLSDHAGAEKHDRRSLSRESSLADIVEGIPPTFAQRPSTKNAEEGGNVELECRFVAIPEAEVKWYFNKTEIKSSQRVVVENQADMHMYCSFLRISQVVMSDQGTYEVIAKNREGEATNTLILNVKGKEGEKKKEAAPKAKEEKKAEPKPVTEAPVIVKGLTPIVCTVGDAVSMETVITGQPKPNLKWYHNNKHLKFGRNVTVTEKDNTYCLKIAKTDLKNDGDYLVRAENSAGTAQTSANVQVQGEVVEFTNTLNDTEVKEKESVMLEVEVTSDKHEVKWHKDGKLLEEVEKTDGFKIEKKGKKHSLIIEKATVHHEGEYVCSVGDQETSCEVSVIELAPEFTKELKTVKSTCGEKAVFEIEISKGDAKTRWFRNGTEIEFNEKIKLIVDGKKQRLEIYNIESIDAGEISCSLGDKQCKGALEVEEPKVNFVAKLPATTSGSTGQDVKITVQLTGSCDVKWLKDGQEVKECDKFTFETEGTSKTIIIKNASIEDVAEYTCVAETVKTITELELDDKEETIEFAQNEMKQELTMKKGEDVVFTVPFKSTLAKKPSVTWLFKSTEIKISEKIITSITKKSASITIKHVESLDCGTYTCKLHNSVSDASVDFKLSVISAPSPPRGPVKATWKTEDTLSIQWVASESDGGAKIEEYIVERNEVGKKSWKQVSASSQLTTEIVGLKKESSYNFRVMARNVVGNSEAFNIEETFTASKAEIKKSLPGSPNVTVTDVTSRSVTLEWNPPSDTGGVHLTGYIIEKRISSSETWERLITVDSSVRIYTVENLKEKSEFFFRISAENEVGVGEGSVTDKVILKTHATPPSPPTAPLEIVPIGPHTLTVEWGAPESDGGAPLEGYKVAVRDAKRQMWMEVGRVTTEVQKLKIQDLEEGSEYFIRIFAKNEVGFSDPLENEEPFKVVRPPDYTEEMEEKQKGDEAPSLSFSTTETLSSWMREANMDADIVSYSKSVVLRRDEYFFHIWHYANKLFK